MRMRLSKRISMLVVPTKEPTTAFVPESTCSRVERSWDLVKERRTEVGKDFMRRAFDERPELRAYFPFASKTDRLSQTAYDAALVAHANLIMNKLGDCVSGMNNMEDILPSLRALGRFHQRKGVKGEYFDIFFRHLMGAIGDALGPEHWTEETAEAWELTAASMMAIMSKPRTSSQIEPLVGWAALMTVVCVYEAVIGPLQLAGFLGERPSTLLWLLDILATFCFFLELCAWYLSSRPRIQNRWFRKMYEWITWPVLDVVMVVTSPFQRRAVSPLHCATVMSSVSGVSWMDGFGLVRLIAIARVVDALRTAENSLLIRQKIKREERSMLKVSKILLTLAYVTHVSACLYCMVARFNLVPKEGMDLAPSSFFPKPEILIGTTTGEVINGYVRAIHWAWVNLAGIGNNESVPETTAECLFVLLIHFIGATLYAVICGYVVEMLTQVSSRENKIISDLESLSDFMRDCGMPRVSQDRIMQGYLMQNMISHSEENGDKDDASFSVYPMDVASRLPAHLEKELTLYGRVYSLKRRDVTFNRCSTDFLLSLTGSLRSSLTMLPGDYLLEQGQASPCQVYLIEHGTMAVIVNGTYAKTLQRGDILGKRWILDASFLNQSLPCEEKGAQCDEAYVDMERVLAHVAAKRSSNGKTKSDRFSEWTFLGEDVAGASVRALEQCTIATGLSARHEVDLLRQRFPHDFSILQNDKEQSEDDRKNVRRMARVAQAAVKFRRGMT